MCIVFCFTINSQMYGVQVQLTVFTRLEHRQCQVMCFNTKVIWNGEETGQAKTDADFLHICEGNITPRDVIIITSAAQTSPSNLRLSLIASSTTDIYYVYLETCLANISSTCTGCEKKDSKSLCWKSCVSHFSLKCPINYSVILSLLC